MNAESKEGTYWLAQKVPTRSPSERIYSGLKKKKKKAAVCASLTPRA